MAALVADRALDAGVEHPVRVAIDGPPWSGLALGSLVADEVAARGRPTVHVRVADFLRPASVRLERGRDDPDAFYDEWIDVGALRREVLEPAGPGGSRHLLPSLWDAARDRSTRAGYRDLRDDTVVVVEGWLLLGRALPVDLTVHVALSAPARARKVPADDAARELPAYARYDAEVRPTEVADIVVRADDARRPAVVERRGPSS